MPVLATLHVVSRVTCRHQQASRSSYIPDTRQIGRNRDAPGGHALQQHEAEGLRTGNRGRPNHVIELILFLEFCVR